jgi:hypothetical protein
MLDGSCENISGLYGSAQGQGLSRGDDLVPRRHGTRNEKYAPDRLKDCSSNILFKLQLLE